MSTDTKWNLWGFIALCSYVLPVSAGAISPNDFIKEAVDLLAERIDGHKDELAADSDALYTVIDDILLPRFDRRFAAGQVLARHWRTASAEQKDRFVDAFYTTLLQRYAEGLLEFDHSRVEVLPFRGDDTKRIATVKTVVQLEDGTRVPVNYALVGRDGEWNIFDVTIEGVSYVRNFRAELDSEIRATSIEDVIVRLENEAAGTDSE